MYFTYLNIIKFCASLTIPQLMEYRDYYKQFKTREYLVACEVLKLRLKHKK
ncbi:MAG: hypothetical protein ACI93N_001769 [Flavobacteriaceae bacterium]|jgi:hypothetical protein